MEAIEIVVSDVAEADSNDQGVLEGIKGNKGKVVLKNYILNDTVAMKKKLRNETSRKEPFDRGTDAKDGSNVVVLMKTSFFEHVKSNFIQDLVSIEGVVKIDNAVGVKVQSANSGEGYVEYALDIVYRVNGIEHAIKMTAYATTCKLMIQPLGEKTIGKLNVSRHFVDTFLLPWCEKAFANKKYNEEEIIEAIKNEIIRLDLLKVDSKKASNSRTRISSTPAIGAKCASRTCRFSGMNLNNKVAVGVCSKCGGFEHFECSKTKSDDRELILKGEQRYFCSSCFSKNPALVAFEPNKTINIPRQLKITPCTKAAEIESESIKTFKCAFCSFDSTDQSIISKHNQENHELQCETCKETLNTKSDLEKHIKDHHTRPCITCHMEFKSIAELKEHMKTSHGPECTICNISFEKTEDLERHLVEQHSGKSVSKFPCQYCPEIHNSSEEMTKHIEESHKINCHDCNSWFPSKEAQEEHLASEHGNKCTICPFTCKDSTTLESHIREDHHSNQLEHHAIIDADVSIKCHLCAFLCKDNDALRAHQGDQHSLFNECSICDELFTSKAILKEHMETEHYSNCSVCGKLFKSSKELQIHLQTCKLYSCGECNDIFYDSGDLNEHVIHNHRNKCNICQEVFSIKSKLEQHVKDKHRFTCKRCSVIAESEEAVINHMKEVHSDSDQEVSEEEVYECEYCDFIGHEIDVMREHIVETHTKKGKDNRFSCDSCDFKSKKRQQLLLHFRTEHMKKTGNSPGDADDDKREETIAIKEEYRKLKNNFERLNAMFQESLEEVDRVKSEYSAKLIEATEKYRVTLSENEELKEKVEILFKLGRGYIDKAEHRKDDKNPVVSEENDSDTVEDSPDDDIECLTAWATNKFRGFKRVSPTTSSVRSKDPPASPPSSRTTSGPAEAPPSLDPKPSQSTVNERLQNIARNNPIGHHKPDAIGSPQYCHFFTNYGRCPFEEKTGKRCKFLHKTAPMCKNGTSCTRTKCMFTHPNTYGRNGPFLGKESYFQNNQTWPQMINPFSNPLNYLTMNPFQMPSHPPYQGERRYQN